MKRSILFAGTLLLLPAGAYAQALPRITGLFPPGARAGTSVDVAIRTGGLEGAREVVVDGSGLTVHLNESGAKADPGDQKVFVAKCGLCHDLRGPSSISRSPDQWVATVDRMIKDRGAPIEPADRTKIVGYLQAAARQSQGLTAKVTVAANATPGVRTLRVVGLNGTSSIFPFEVSTLPEIVDEEPNNTVEKPQDVTLPVIVNGQLSQGDQDCYRFHAAKGQRIVFNCKSYRLHPAIQQYLFPVLYLYDDKGKELERNTGYFSLDPLIDWTAKDEGTYTIAVRDMLYRGSPSSIYRLSIGTLGYNTYLYPPGGRQGASTTATISGDAVQPATITVPAADKEPLGVKMVSTPQGPMPFVVGQFPEYLKQAGNGPQTVSLPVSINGKLERSGAGDRYTFSLTKDQLGVYSFEVFAERLGSPLVPRLTLRNAQGQVLTSGTQTQEIRDPRLDYNFSRPGEYAIEIGDANDRSGEAYVYRISAGPSAPDLQVTLGPDNPNLSPGASVYLPLRVVRRTGITGDITVSAENLPPGVTASPTVVPPNETQSFVILTAAPDAKPGEMSSIRVVCTATANGETIRREAMPFEIYKIGNNNLYAPRSSMVVTLGPEAGWKVSVLPASPQMSMENGPMTVTVKLQRNGFEGDLPFAIVGVPRGIQAPQAILFKKGMNEMTFTLRPGGGGGGRRNKGGDQRPGEVPSKFLIAVVHGREGEGMQVSSAAVPITVMP
jgi:hypothetical protein